MQPSLNYDDSDEKFILLGRVFEFIENEKTKNILNRSGFRNRSMAVICIKIFFMSLFFNYQMSKVIDELNSKEELRNFAKIYDVPTEHSSIRVFLVATISSISLNWAIHYYPPSLNHTLLKTDEYIVDATPVEYGYQRN